MQVGRKPVLQGLAAASLSHFLPGIVHDQRLQLLASQGPASAVAVYLFLQAKPQSCMRAEGQKVGLVLDHRKFGPAEKFQWTQSLNADRSKFNRLRETRQVHHDQKPFAPRIGE